MVRKERIVEDTFMEFPRINPRLVGKEHKYFYALGNEYLHPNRVRKLPSAVVCVSHVGDHMFLRSRYLKWTLCPATS